MVSAHWNFFNRRDDWYLVSKNTAYRWERSSYGPASSNLLFLTMEYDNQNCNDCNIERALPEQLLFSFKVIFNFQVEKS